MTNQLAKELWLISDIAKDVQTVKKYMVPFLAKLWDTYGKEGFLYYNRRIEYNNKMMRLANSMVKILEEFCKKTEISATFVLTSSLNANINLVGDSDIDISMLVNNCDYAMCLDIGRKLASLGFEYKRFVNPAQPLNCYYLYSKIEDGVEFEIKLRDADRSRIVLNLHKYLEDKLTDEEMVAITYGKFIFKAASKNPSDNEEKLSYLVFKKLVFERYMAEIEGGFMLEVHY